MSSAGIPFLACMLVLYEKHTDVFRPTSSLFYFKALQQKNHKVYLQQLQLFLGLRLRHQDMPYSVVFIGAPIFKMKHEKKKSKSIAAEKILKYRADYNNNPPISVAFMPAIASTSGRLHSEFIRLLFLQAHRETDRFFAASGVQSAQSNRGTFHFKRAVFLGELKVKIGSSLAKAATLCVNLNIDGAPITSRSHTHPSHSQESLLLTSSLSLGFPVPRTTECM
jgi:hypothetical protein